MKIKISGDKHSCNNCGHVNIMNLKYDSKKDKKENLYCEKCNEVIVEFK